MCGIYFCLSCCTDPCSELSAIFLVEDLQRRGPDFCGELFSGTQDGSSEQNPHASTKFQLNFLATVLHLRGNKLSAQPRKDTDGNVLLWNGEVFVCGEPEIVCQCETFSDTACISSSLQRCDGQDLEIFKNFSKTKGPFAFVYYDRKRDSIYFGRDLLGRRSLIYAREALDGLILSSVCVAELASVSGEVPADGLFKIVFKDGHMEFTLFPWNAPWNKMDGFSQSEDLKNFCVVNPTTIAFIPPETSAIIECEWLTDDSTLMPMISYSNSVPPGSANLVLVLDDYLNNEPVQNLVSQFEKLLRTSIEIRVKHAIQMCKSCKSVCGHAKIAVLFSGGIDSLLMAYLAARDVPEHEPIDLLNVAFTSDENCMEAEAAPDRITGTEGYEILCNAFPNHPWNFVRINVTKSEVDEIRTSRLRRLIIPQQSVLDCSLGTALWFASRGHGILDEAVPYTSPARVVFSGLGADELLGGYSRHRTRFQAGGEKAVETEMMMDIKRISSRNCGRDDRIISDHGREARYPYLDEDVVSFLLSLPLRYKCDLSLPRGLGDKLLLRLLAVKLGLKSTAILEKRAMQFGTRIAKIDKTKNGYDASPALINLR